MKKVLATLLLMVIGNSLIAAPALASGASKSAVVETMRGGGCCW